MTVKQKFRPSAAFLRASKQQSNSTRAKLKFKAQSTQVNTTSSFHLRLTQTTKQLQTEVHPLRLARHPMICLHSQSQVFHRFMTAKHTLRKSAVFLLASKQPSRSTAETTKLTKQSTQVSTVLKSRSQAMQTTTQSKRELNT